MSRLNKRLFYLRLEMALNTHCLFLFLTPIFLALFMLHSNLHPPSLIFSPFCYNFYLTLSQIFFYPSIFLHLSSFLNSIFHGIFHSNNLYFILLSSQISLFHSPLFLSHSAFRILQRGKESQQRNKWSFNSYASSRESCNRMIFFDQPLRRSKKDLLRKERVCVRLPYQRCLL